MSTWSDIPDLIRRLEALPADSELKAVIGALASRCAEIDARSNAYGYDDVRGHLDAAADAVDATFVDADRTAREYAELDREMVEADRGLPC